MQFTAEFKAATRRQKKKQTTNNQKLKRPLKKITKIMKHYVNQMLHKHYGCSDRKTKIINNQ